MTGYDFSCLDPHSLGMACQGETVRFLGKNGHDLELEDALGQFEVGQILLVAVCRIGSWVSYYRFNDEPGVFNTVMFEPTAASADTLPKGQDAQQGLAGTESGAVPAGQTPNLLNQRTNNHATRRADMSELKSCPLCGKQPARNPIHPSTFQIHCTQTHPNQHLVCVTERTEAEAIAKWNTRND